MLSHLVVENVAHYAAFFHSANGMLYHYPFFGVILVVNLFTPEPTPFGFSFFCLALMNFGQEILSQPQDTHGQTHAYSLLWSDRVILFNVIFMPMSFHVFCFVDDDTLVVNHEMCLYGVPFLLA